MIMVDTILDRFVYRHGQIVHFPCILSNLCYEYSIIFQCLTSLLKLDGIKPDVYVNMDKILEEGIEQGDIESQKKDPLIEKAFEILSE